MADRPTPRQLIGIGEAAAMLGVSIGTVRNWADKGLIPHQLLPSGYRRFTIEEIERVLADMEQQATPKKLAA